MSPAFCRCACADVSGSGRAEVIRRAEKRRIGTAVRQGSVLCKAEAGSAS